MATDFPTSLDSLSNPTTQTGMNVLSHSVQHANENDAIEAMQEKIGIDGSSDPSSLDYKISQLEAGSALITRMQYNIQITSPAIDGIETVFTIPSGYVVGTLRVYRASPSGGAERLVDIVATNGTTVTVSSPPMVGETLYCDYITPTS